MCKAFRTVLSIYYIFGVFFKFRIYEIKYQLNKTGIHFKLKNYKHIKPSSRIHIFINGI